MASLLWICQHSLLVHDGGEEHLAKMSQENMGSSSLSFEGGEYDEMVGGTYNQF